MGMHAMTVTGPVGVDDLGVVLPHEHLFIDLRNQFTEFDDSEKQRVSRDEVSLRNLGALRRNPYAVKDNLCLDDMETIVEEVMFFKNRGGNTIVNCTPIGTGRNAAKLKEVAKRTGLNIIAGTGYYTYDTHPEQMGEWTAEEIAGQIVRELTEGIEDTQIKAGVIGEIGTSHPIHPDEEKNLIAAALAFQETGLPIHVHTYPWASEGIQALDILKRHGVDPSKIVICHLDVEPDVSYMRSVLDQGAVVEFDNFGKEFYIDSADRAFAGGIFIQDIERVRLIKRLIEWGYERQLLITNDICLKMMLRAYGGWGYDHILRNIVPMMLDEGISQETIDLFIRKNPKRLFMGAG